MISFIGTSCRKNSHNVLTNLYSLIGKCEKRAKAPKKPVNIESFLLSLTVHQTIMFYPNGAEKYSVAFST